MTTITSTELSITPETMDNSRITINTSTSKLILESNSSDITISKYETPKPFVNVPPTSNSSLTMKTQLLPLVYIPNASKVPFAAVNKANTNVVVNNIPSIQFATINKNNPTTTTTTINQQNLILATGRSQSLLLQKQQTSVVPIVPVSVSGGAKITGAYLTMLKPFSNSNEPNSVNKFQVASNPVPTLTDISVLNNNATQISQNSAQKFLITPMPKVTSNRLPATVTTNSVQPKITVLPMPVPNSEPVVTTQKVYNVKVTDGQLQNDLIGENSYDGESNSGNLICDEIIDLDSPEKTEINNKTYELSITEDSVSSQGDTKSSMIISKCSTKDAPKFPKHGVSILKKNYFLERRIEKPNNLVTINNGSLNSLSENKESSASEESVIITIPQKQEKERRRKSNFSYRKDFDDMEVIINNNLLPNSIDKNDNMQDSLKLEDPRKKLTSEIEIELIKEKSEENSTNSQEDLDFQKLLDWDDGIGTLPGSTLKFIINEFNILEYITEEEYKVIIEKRITKAKEKMIAELQEELRCVECGCYGLPSEFINPKYCSLDCQEVNRNKQKKEAMKAEKYKNKKKKQQQRFRSEDSVIKMEKKHESVEDDISEEDSVDNLSIIQDKFYPWSCKKKGFSWSKYLDHIKAKPAPVKLFKDPFPYNRNGFRPGMKLEGVDPQHPSYFCVLTVAEVVGYRMRLHFDGYSENYDFWCNADSMNIFPMGWCEKHSHTLQSPPGYTVENFNWVQYLRSTKSIAAPKHLFANRAGQAICPNGFRIGMKLEAVDRKNTSLVCVATVRDMMDNRILVHFDSWDDIYDYWTDPTSPYIHPVGWCDQYGHNLTPPIDYPNPETFSWEEYLKATKSVAAPVRAFKQRPACGFKRGMRLECVDKRVPQLIRVATVDDVKEHQIRIHFDGWIDRYSYWVDDDSPDIHPVGWCQKTGHPLEPPLTPEDVYDFVDCRTIGCKGLGHIDGPRYVTHSSQKHCPYVEENIDMDRILPDRLLSPDKSPEEAVPVSREPKECKIKPRVGRPPKYLRLERPKPDPDDEPPEKKPKRKYIKRIKSEILELSEQQKARTFIDQSNIVPAEQESWNRHSRFLKKYITTDADPRMWSYREVINFISSIPCCEENTDVFKKEKIDGEALLSLSQNDILTILKLKVGPGVKLYNSIILLRQQIKEEMCT